MDVLHITLLGHKDHGKSTLLGNLLMLTKTATQARIKEAETYSKKLHKSFEPAFIMDSFYEERLGGLTIDITRAEIPYKNVAFSFIDVPGHEELIKNMISGASYASTAVLLVSVQRDEGIKDQTKRHLFIARMLGIDRLIVVVNKMDTVGYSESAFRAVKEALSPFIESIGFSEKNVAFIPISAYNGDNLVSRSRNTKWYTGKPLIEKLYEMSRSALPSNSNGSARMVLQGFLGGERDNVAGRMLRGSMRKGDKIHIEPISEQATVKRIILNGRSASSTSAGDSVALKLDRNINGDARGSVVYGDGDVVKSTNSINALVFVTGKFGRGMSIRFNGVEVPAVSIRITKHIDPLTGKSYKAKGVEPLTAVEATLKLKSKIPAESFSETKELGRFVLYSGREFSGIGTIK